MPIIIVILGLLAVLFAMPMHAQTQPWSLEQCCDYAVEHNITIKQQENQCRQQEIQLSTARNQRLPDLSGSAGQNFSFGRGLTEDNIYANTNTTIPRLPRSRWVRVCRCLLVSRYLIISN